MTQGVNTVTEIIMILYSFCGSSLNETADDRARAPIAEICVHGNFQVAEWTKILLQPKKWRKCLILRHKPTFHMRWFNSRRAVKYQLTAVVLVYF
jgi:hypothetical protein